MRYRIWTADAARVVPIGRDPLSVDAGDVVIVAVCRDVEHAGEVMRALNADDVRHKIARGKR